VARELIYRVQEKHMMSSRFVTGAVLVGFLAATPALAQNARPRGGDHGGDRGGDRAGSRGDRGGDRGGSRQADSPRVYQRNAPDRAPQRSYDNRSYDSGRRSEASRQYTAPRQYDARRYQAPRQYDNRSYGNRSYNAPRGYVAPRAYQYDRRSYSSRGYVAPRRDPYYRSNSYRSNSYRGYSYRNYNPRYYAPRYNYSRRYVYGGYRGVYGYGGGYLRSRIVTVVPWRPYHYRPRFSIGVYYGAGGVYDYGYTPSYYYDPIPGQVYGGVRITEAPRDAQVFADGYYVGIVDDFDGVFQHVNLEAGQHRIEVRARDVEPISFDVYVQPGRTITLRADDYDDGYYDENDGY
jgi:hypothetical protein